MPNVMKVLKAEISRLAKKEAKSATQKLRADTVSLKRRAAQQGRLVAALQRELKKFSGLAKQQRTSGLAPSEQELRGARISSGMVRRVRAKLGLSQAQLAKLVGVSSISIYMWESKSGRLNLRNATRTSFLAVRKLGKREARARLAGASTASIKAPAKKRVSRRKRRK